ncbi:FAD-dependent oxidoreductase [Paenibacillus chungangensis]|uniref:FAD-dependent oxidoreductase n=1 Tax=Paenibacillus chungangensis TaxID=696535 RepID=A0ABW3HU86_9BACL
MGQDYDVIVYGATPGGIAAAISTARKGRRTLLLEPSAYIGGMMTSGLGRTDIDDLKASGAIYREFADKVLKHYSESYGLHSSQVKDCNKGMYFEPSVARMIFWEMTDVEQLLEVKCEHEIASVAMEDNRLTAIRVKVINQLPILHRSASVFIDCTYEGDLAAMAGVPYWSGRESRDVWNEEYAGKIYMNFDETKEVLPGSTGVGDHRIQAYNYRLCLTDMQDRKAEVTKPNAYRREDYISLVEDVAASRVNSIRDVLNILPVPNGKTDANNHHYCMCSSDLPDENGDYLEGSGEVRRSIAARHRTYLQGLLWFLQNDEALPAAFRIDAGRWGYAADEFVDTDHFPPQIYVREGRRIHGEYVFTENDARLAPGLGRSPIHYDSIATGAYAIDSHAVQKREPEGKNIALEGFLGLGWLTEIYQIPYGVMVPRQMEGLLVPVAVSATHMGFGTIRMEPCWMQLGYAAGIAADLSIEGKLPLRDIPIDLLQDELLDHNQLITFFEDIDPLSDEGKAIQYFGAKGVFTTYKAESDRPIRIHEASGILAKARSLPGGQRMPVLPATDRLLPTGTDMGPRFHNSEISPEAYWKEHPYLSRVTYTNWLRVATAQLCGEALPDRSEEREDVSIGEFCNRVYAILKSQRKGLLANASKGRR